MCIPLSSSSSLGAVSAGDAGLDSVLSSLAGVIWGSCFGDSGFGSFFGDSCLGGSCLVSCLLMSGFGYVGGASFLLLAVVEGGGADCSDPWLTGLIADSDDTGPEPDLDPDPAPWLVELAEA